MVINASSRYPPFGVPSLSSAHLGICLKTSSSGWSKPCEVTWVDDIKKVPLHSKLPELCSWQIYKKLITSPELGLSLCSRVLAKNLFWGQILDQNFSVNIIYRQETLFTQKTIHLRPGGRDEFTLFIRSLEKSRQKVTKISAGFYYCRLFLYRLTFFADYN